MKAADCRNISYSMSVCYNMIFTGRVVTLQFTRRFPSNFLTVNFNYFQSPSSSSFFFDTFCAAAPAYFTMLQSSSKPVQQSNRKTSPKRSRRSNPHKRNKMNQVRSM